MKPDILYIEREGEGVEEFRISTAKYNIYTHDDGTWEFVVEIETDKGLKRLPELEELYGKESKPGFESTAILGEKEVKLKPGSVISQREPYDKKRDHNLSWFYYAGGGGLEELRVEVLDVQPDHIEVKLTGVYDATDSKIALHAKLKRDPKLKRGVT